MRHAENGNTSEGSGHVLNHKDAFNILLENRDQYATLTRAHLVLRRATAGVVRRRVALPLWSGTVPALPALDPFDDGKKLKAAVGSADNPGKAR